jgi:hypothetical protein
VIVQVFFDFGEISPSGRILATVHHDLQELERGVVHPVGNRAHLLDQRELAALDCLLSLILQAGDLGPGRPLQVGEARLEIAPGFLEFGDPHLAEQKHLRDLLGVPVGAE